MVGTRAWIGGLFSRSSNKKIESDKYLNYTLTPIQEERLHRLQGRSRVPFDESQIDHQEALQALWDAAFPNVKLKGLISEQWKDMGWQGANPSTDFRWAVDSFHYRTCSFSRELIRLLLKQGGERSKWEYPFAVAGINVSFMLIQIIDLHSEKPRCVPGLNFVKLLGEDEDAFDILYCIAFTMMDAQWLAMHASYMEFNYFIFYSKQEINKTYDRHKWQTSMLDDLIIAVVRRKILTEEADDRRSKNDLSQIRFRS
ncbi:hypothetical protein OROGR_007444 [Orobanche gracilis]